MLVVLLMVSVKCALSWLWWGLRSSACRASKEDGGLLARCLLLLASRFHRLPKTTTTRSKQQP